MHESERRELLDLLKGDDRFTFNRDVGSLGQTFDNTFDLGEDSPITRSATPAPSKSLNDEKGGVLKNLEFLIPKVPEFVGVMDLRAEFSDFGTGPFDPPLQQNPANVTGEPRKIPGAPLEEVPVPGLPDPQLRGAPADPTTAATGGVNTPQIALLLSSLGQAIGGDSIGGRIAGAAQQFAQQRVTAGLSEKILSGEKITAQDLLGVDPQTALKIKTAEASEDRAEREFKLKEGELALGGRTVTTQEKAQATREKESDVRIQGIEQDIRQRAAKFKKGQDFDSQGFLDVIGSELGLDSLGEDFSGIDMSFEEATFVAGELSRVRQADLDRKSREKLAGIRTRTTSISEKDELAGVSNSLAVSILSTQRARVLSVASSEGALPNERLAAEKRLAKIDAQLANRGVDPSTLNEAAPDAFGGTGAAGVINLTTITDEAELERRVKLLPSGTRFKVLDAEGKSFIITKPGK